MFDPLHKWLGIPPDEQPPNHYRLLGITVYENDPDVIDAAADKQLAFLHDLTNGEQAEMAEQLSNQVSAARLCLLDDEKKIAYDDVLRNTFDKPQSGEANHTSGQAGIDPAYQVQKPDPQPAAPTPVVHAKKRRKPRKHTKPGTSYARLSIFLCSIALVLIGVGVWTGRITLDLSLLESLGLWKASDPAPIPVSHDVTPQDVPSITSEPNDRQDPAATSNAAADSTASSSATTERPTTTPPADPSPPSPKRGDRSLADLAHSSSNDKESPPQIEKSPLPSESEFDEKMALVRELYEENYRNANTSSEKIELAKLMHRDGQETTDDTAGRYVLWHVARDILTGEGEYALALGIVDNLNAHYQDFDSNRMKVKALHDSASNISEQQISGFLDAVVAVVSSCGRQDQFELAKSLSDFIVSELRSHPAKPKLDTLRQVSSEIESRKELYTQFLAAREKLESSADDAEANQTVGHYLCLVQGHWDEGLKHLALGTDPDIRGAAVRELAIQSDSEGAMQLADAWYSIAKTQEDLVGQANLHRHAHQWYARAKPNAQGLNLTKVEARLSELQKLIPNQAGDDSISGDGSEVKVLGYRVKTSADSKSDFADRRGNEFKLGMGPRRDGRGEAMVGVELQGAKTIKIVGFATEDMADIDPYSKAGFVIDYHTPGGYAKRIFLGLGLRPARQFSDAPLWGAAKSPDLTLDIGRSDSYEVDLTRWAPSTWDGQCWFTIYMQNVGANRTLVSTVSW